jgi:Tol biopolymer transport system component
MSYQPVPIFSAAFAPDGETIVYSAAKEGNTPELFVIRRGYPEARPLGARGINLLSISSKGELAVQTKARFIAHRLFKGTLARMPLEGGAPREILENVRQADWSPDGSSLAIIRDVDGKDRLEYPIGKVLHETAGYLSDLRFSPAGDRIAFFEHPYKFDDRGVVAVVDLAGKSTVLSGVYWGEEGRAGSPAGDEVLFSAGTGYANFSIYGVTLSGRTRAALQSAGGLTIHGVSHDGRWLVTRDDLSEVMLALAPGESEERDLSFLDLTTIAQLSPDGRTLLFVEAGAAAGLNYAVCLRQTDGSPVIRLGEGWASSLSPDGKWALAIIPVSPAQAILYPTGPGEPHRLEQGGIVSYSSGGWFPDGKSVLLCGSEPGHAERCYVQEVTGGKPRAVTPEGTSSGACLSPDGERLFVRGPADHYLLYPLGGGEPRAIPWLAADETVSRFSRDGRSLFVFRGSEIPARIERVDIDTGRRAPFKVIAPLNRAGALNLASFSLADDERSYAYSYRRQVSHLFVVEGAR